MGSGLPDTDTVQFIATCIHQEHFKNKQLAMDPEIGSYAAKNLLHSMSLQAIMS